MNKNCSTFDNVRVILTSVLSSKTTKIIKWIKVNEKREHFRITALSFYLKKGTYIDI